MLVVNGKGRDYVPGTTVAGVLEEMNCPAGRVAVERNGEIVPRKQYCNVRLEDSDRLEIVNFVGGG